MTHVAKAGAAGLPIPNPMRYDRYDARRACTHMAIACLLGRHAIVARGVRNGSYEFARCDRCRRDLKRGHDGVWKRVPKGFRVVWKPRTGEGSEDIVPAGTAAFAREVDLRGVTVVGARTYGAQRFALVVLNANDERDYAALVDPLGMDGPVAARIARPGPSRARRAPEATRADLSDVLGASDPFDAPLRRASRRVEAPASSTRARRA